MTVVLLMFSRHLSEGGMKDRRLRHSFNSDFWWCQVLFLLKLRISLRKVMHGSDSDYYKILLLFLYVLVSSSVNGCSEVK